MKKVCRILPENMTRFLDRANPHLIAVHDPESDICGSICRESRMRNGGGWSIHWNAGRLGMIYTSVKTLIEENPQFVFYFIQL